MMNFGLGSKNQDVLAREVKLLNFQMEPPRMQQQRPAEVGVEVVEMNQGRNLSGPPDGDRLLRAAVRDEDQGHTGQSQSIQHLEFH